ncbi:hypothetical protein LUZ60_007895 [Juncus effusus]|nr:hypothetical protein LUZ60_007895 [Juncus effusus]
MGSAVSSHSHSDSDADADADNPASSTTALPLTLPASIPSSKLLEQEPEILLCRAAASPLSPQPSNAGTPRMIPSIRVWDPCHIISPPPLLNSASTSNHIASNLQNSVEVVLISHGESETALRPDLIAGRATAAGLTARGERQARALAVFLKSRGIRFESVYSSPLIRARATASLVCNELEFPENQIQESESLAEMSEGQWEGLPKSEIYTSQIEKSNSDFAPPSGESLRQVTYRVIEFLNRVILRLPEKEKQLFGLPFSRQTSMNSFSRPSLQRKKSGKSRLQFVGDNSNDLEEDNVESNGGGLNCVGVFTHATPIKCLITAVLDCGPMVSKRICVDESSVTVLEHCLRDGWKIKRLNDTSHLRLL